MDQRCVVKHGSTTLPVRHQGESHFAGDVDLWLNKLQTHDPLVEGLA
jgi:hypothetical protein